MLDPVCVHEASNALGAGAVTTGDLHGVPLAVKSSEGQLTGSMLGKGVQLGLGSGLGRCSAAVS